MRDTTLNGGESGSWVRLLDPDQTQPILSPRNLSDSDIETLISRLEESPELAPEPLVYS